MVAYKVADMEVDMVADIDIDININMEIQFGERVGHGGWLIGPKLLRPEAYPACAFSKLCEFFLVSSTSWRNNTLCYALTTLFNHI